MINLIYNKDIKALENKGQLTCDELLLLQSKGLKESYVQQKCNQMFQALGLEYERKYGQKVMEFVQMDNGDSSIGDIGKYQRIALCRRKKREGTKRGIPDSCLFLGTPCGQYSKIILVEFKRVGAPSSIEISDDQKHYHDWFNKIGFSSYITNNVVFFKNHILKEVQDFFENSTKIPI